MLRFRGSPALSPFRLEKLLGVLRQRVPVVTDAYAEFVHFVDGALSVRDREVLDRLLHYGPTPMRRHPGGAPLFLVIPVPAPFRPGRPRPPTSLTTAACVTSAASSAAWRTTWTAAGR